MILNKNNIPYLNQGASSFKKSSPYLNQIDFSSGMYWYIEIADSCSFTDECVQSAIPKNIIELLKKQNSVHLIIVNPYEGFHSIVECIYKKIILGLGVPENKISFYSGSANIFSVVTSVASACHKLPIKTYWVRIAEYELSRYQHRFNITPTPVITEKKFLSLNRRWRPHRTTLIGLLIAKDILKHGYVSLQKNIEESVDSNWDNAYNEIRSLNYKNTDILSLLETHRDKICSTESLKVDDVDLNNSMQHISSKTLEFYNKTMFSVVTETNFYTTYPFENSICLTEKIFKPILYRHPFIVVSVPHTLRSIQSIGYKTFYPFIDEKYDSIESDSDRMLMIVNEIEKICLLSTNEIAEFTNSVKDICDYNHNLFLERNKIKSCTLQLSGS